MVVIYSASQQSELLAVDSRSSQIFTVLVKPTVR